MAAADAVGFAAVAAVAAEPQAVRPVSTNVLEEAIGRLAREFRQAFERCDLSSFPIDFREFPRGSCGRVSLLLSKYLQVHGYSGFEYVWGERDGRSHAWLERNGLAVDITADQFGRAAVTVTRELDWYRSFAERDRHQSDFELYDQHSARELAALYSRVMVHIDAPA